MTNAGMKSAFDLTAANIHAPAHLSALGQKAAQVLQEEVAKRTRVRWAIVQDAPVGNAPRITLEVGTDAALPADGFEIRTQVATAQIEIIGNDARGLLFGVGYLLRHLEMTKGQITLPGALTLTTAPHYALRGHQLGYRDKTKCL